MLVTAFRDQENRYDHVFFLKKQNFLSPRFFFKETELSFTPSSRLCWAKLVEFSIDEVDKLNEFEVE